MNKFELFKEQKEVIDQLAEKNSALVVAKTGSGKTYIFLKKAQDEILQNERAFIFTPTNALLEQHYNTALKICSVPVYMVKVNTNLKVLEKKGIFLFTGHYGQVLLRKNLLPQDVKVIIFDEAHKAKSSSNCYCEIAKNYNCKLYGFTASPGLESDKKKIMVNLKLNHVVIGNSPYNYKRDLNLINCKIDPEIEKICKELSNYIKLRYPKFYSYFVFDHGLSVTNYMLFLSKQPSFKQNINKIGSMFEYYQFFGFYYLYEQLYFESLEAFNKVIDKMEQKCKIRVPSYIKNLITKNKTYPSKYYSILERILKNKGVTLIFFENFNTCKDFGNFLLKKDFKPSDFVIFAGKSKITTKQRKVNINIQEAEELKIILSTSVIEEGISIKNVDEVVFFKPVTNTTRYIQREGRTGRYKDGIISIVYYEETYESKAVKKILKIKSKL